MECARKIIFFGSTLLYSPKYSNQFITVRITEEDFNIFSSLKSIDSLKEAYNIPVVQNSPGIRKVKVAIVIAYSYVNLFF